MSNIQLSRRNFFKQAASGLAVGTLAGLSPIALSSTNVAVSKASSVMYGPQPGVAKLNANENPYGPSDAAIAAIMQASKNGGAYYAYDAGLTLMDMIAEKYGLARENISLSAGSSGVLSSTALMASKKGAILGPDLFWDTTAKAPERQGSPSMKRLVKTADLSIDLDAFYDAISDDVAMVQVTNPNNPTGTIVDPKKLEAFCIKASKKCLVLVDEAYNELTDNPPAHSMIKLINQGHNVVVARTFSKIYGLAGMRVGYLLSSAENIEQISKFGMGGYSMNQAGLAAAIASFNDEKFLKFSRDKIEQAREMVMAAVKANGLSALPSTTNFIYVNLGTGNAEVFREKMAEQNVLIRGIYQDYNNWSRVSMGAIEHVQQYIDAMPIALEGMYKAAV